MIVENAKLFLTPPAAPVERTAPVNEGEGFDDHLRDSLSAPQRSAEESPVESYDTRDQGGRDAVDDQATTQEQRSDERTDDSEAQLSDGGSNGEQDEQPVDSNDTDTDAGEQAVEAGAQSGETTREQDGAKSQASDEKAGSNAPRVNPRTVDPLKLIQDRATAQSRDGATPQTTDQAERSAAGERSNANPVVSQQANTQVTVKPIIAQELPNAAQDSPDRAAPTPQNTRPIEERPTESAVRQNTAATTETTRARPATPIVTEQTDDRTQAPTPRDTTARDNADSQSNQRQQPRANPEPTTERPAPRANRVIEQAQSDQQIQRAEQSARAALASIASNEGTTQASTSAVQDVVDAGAAARAAAATANTGPANAAGPDAAMPNSPDLEPGRITEQVIRGLRGVVNQRGGSLTIRLQPPDLGALRIDVQMTGSVVRVAFDAATDAAREMLSRQMGTLRQALESQGLSVERLQVQAPLADSNTTATQDDEDAEADGRQSGAFGQSPDDRDGQEGSGGEDEATRFERELLDLMA